MFFYSTGHCHCHAHLTTIKYSQSSLDRNELKRQCRTSKNGSNNGPYHAPVRCSSNNSFITGTILQVPRGDVHSLLEVLILRAASCLFMALDSCSICGINHFGGPSSLRALFLSSTRSTDNRCGVWSQLSSAAGSRTAETRAPESAVQCAGTLLFTSGKLSFFFK